MTTVFLLVIYLGDAVQQSDMHFRDINRCKYFASRIRIQASIRLKKKEAIAEAKRKQRRMIENTIIGACCIFFLGTVGVVLYIVFSLR